MKRIVASVGLVAVGVSGLQAGALSDLTTESGKPWTVSAALRGFYDDNINTIPDKQPLLPGAHRSSTGFEVSPALQLSLPMEQTTVGFGYVYSLKYYQNRPQFNTDNYDQTHNISAALTHVFSERYQLAARDSFVIGQEPDILRAGSTYGTFQRISGDNIRNYGALTFSAQLTPELGAEVGYANTLYDYADPANAGLLNQLDHVAHLDGRYQLLPQTIGVVGYQFRETDYTGDQKTIVNGITLKSDIRNARSHYVYVGLDHNFRPDFTGSFRAGGRYTDYYNYLVAQSDFSPYAMASLKYTYLPESYVEAGFSYDYNAASVLALSAQSATLFAALHHRITPKLHGSIIAQFQNSAYYAGKNAAAYGGVANDTTDRFFLIGLNLQYRFTPNLSAEVGYNYDKLDSEGPNSWDRNRVYVGVTGSY